jgi:hypothetical protein
LHGWATGNVALYTTDGGVTWLQGSMIGCIMPSTLWT